MEENSILWPSFKFWYLPLVLGFTLFIRFLLCFTKTIEIKLGGLDDASEKLSCKYGWRETTMKAFCNKFENEKVKDYFLPSIVGLIELCTFPILMYSNLYEYIGGWITLKTLGQWKMWAESRTIYNRFIIGNLLLVIFSYVLFKFFLI